jgi:ribose-phosphate pyrophosphokinase
MAKPKFVVLSGSSNLPLATEICDELGVSLTPTHIERFSNENISVQIDPDHSVRKRNVFIIQSLYPHPNTMLVELMLMIDAAKFSSAGDICVVMPHYSYARSDKKDKSHVSIAAALWAKTMVTAGAKRFLCMTLHNEHVVGFFNRPIDHLQGSQVICDHLAKRDLTNAVALFDLGQDKRSGGYADVLGMPIAVYDKRRKGDTEVEIKSITGDVSDKDVYIFDDEIASGSSIAAITWAIQDHNPRSINVACVHGLFCGNAKDLMMTAPITEVITTNTIDVPPENQFSKLTTLTVAPLMAKAISRINEGKSVSGLFRNIGR